MLILYRVKITASAQRPRMPGCKQQVTATRSHPQSRRGAQQQEDLQFLQHPVQIRPAAVVPVTQHPAAFPRSPRASQGIKYLKESQSAPHPLARRTHKTLREKNNQRFIWPWCNSEMLQVPEPASLQGDEGQQHSKAPASCEKGDCDLDLELEKS